MTDGPGRATRRLSGAGADAEEGSSSAAPPRVRQGLPRIVLLVIVAAVLTITLAGLRATSDIPGPVLLALALTITVHPVRRRLVRSGPPEWPVSLPSVTTVCLLPQYVADLESSRGHATAWLQDHGISAGQVLEADPAARWVLPLVSGRAEPGDPEPTAEGA